MTKALMGIMLSVTLLFAPPSQRETTLAEVADVLWKEIQRDAETWTPNEPDIALGSLEPRPEDFPEPRTLEKIYLPLFQDI